MPNTIGQKGSTNLEETYEPLPGPSKLTKKRLISEEKRVYQDHDYLYFSGNSDHKKQKTTNKKNYTDYYKETIDILQDIDNSVKGGLQKINETLKEGFGHLTEFVFRKNEKENVKDN